MSEHPILFSGPMVRAILEGRKTQTRRPIGFPRRGAFALQDDGSGWWPYQSDDGESTTCDDGIERPMSCPFGQPGDRLWVRETWASPQPGIVAYRADGEAGAWMGDGGGGRIWVHHGWIHGATDGTREGRWYGLSKYGGRWRPSIHMPRRASRITLEVTDVRVQRLQEISEEDARAEGMGISDGRAMCGPQWSFRDGFSDLWDSINGKRAPWESNPWVWAVSFRQVAP